MVNLNKKRVTIYFYLVVVLTLIFGLSFAVKGNKITGNAILETTKSVLNELVSFSSFLILFGFLFSLVFALFIIRHASEIKRDLHKNRIKHVSGIVVTLLIISFVSFGVYFEDNNSITGYATTVDCNPLTNKCGGTLAWRNNNPGNLVSGVGSIGTYKSHAVFRTEEEGKQALIQDLTTKLSGNSGAIKSKLGDYDPSTTTLKQLIEVYTPQADIQNYLKVIEQETGYKPETTLSRIEASTLSEGIRRMEGWQVGTITQPSQTPAQPEVPTGQPSTPSEPTLKEEPIIKTAEITIDLWGKDVKFGVEYDRDTGEIKKVTQNGNLVDKSRLLETVKKNFRLNEVNEDMYGLTAQIASESARENRNFWFFKDRSEVVIDGITLNGNSYSGVSDYDKVLSDVKSRVGTEIIPIGAKGSIEGVNEPVYYIGRDKSGYQVWTTRDGQGYKNLEVKDVKTEIEIYTHESHPDKEFRIDPLSGTVQYRYLGSNKWEDEHALQEQGLKLERYEQLKTLDIERQILEIRKRLAERENEHDYSEEAYRKQLYSNSDDYPDYLLKEISDTKNLLYTPDQKSAARDELSKREQGRKKIEALKNFRDALRESTEEELGEVINGKEYSEDERLAAQQELDARGRSSQEPETPTEVETQRLEPIPIYCTFVEYCNNLGFEEVDGGGMKFINRGKTDIVLKLKDGKEIKIEPGEGYPNLNKNNLQSIKDSPSAYKNDGYEFVEITEDGSRIFKTDEGDYLTIEESGAQRIRTPEGRIISQRGLPDSYKKEGYNLDRIYSADITTYKREDGTLLHIYPDGSQRIVISDGKIIDPQMLPSAYKDQGYKVDRIYSNGITTYRKDDGTLVHIYPDDSERMIVSGKTIDLAKVEFVPGDRSIDETVIGGKSVTKVYTTPEGTIYKNNDAVYVLRQGSDRAIIATEANKGYYQWTDPINGKDYRISVDDKGYLEESNLNEKGQQEWTRIDDANFIQAEKEEEEATKANDETLKKAVNDATYQATSALLRLTLGKFAQSLISDYCKNQYDSSDYSGGQSTTNYNTNTQQLLSPQNINQSANNCVGSSTTVTAQAKKTIVGTGFTYQTSWTITPCKEDVLYTIYLANSINDSVGIAADLANKGIVKSESKQLSFSKDYSQICIQVSDTSVNNGYACFNIV